MHDVRCTMSEGRAPFGALDGLMHVLHPHLRADPLAQLLAQLLAERVLAGLARGALAAARGEMARRPAAGRRRAAAVASITSRG